MKHFHKFRRKMCLFFAFTVLIILGLGHNVAAEEEDDLKLEEYSRRIYNSTNGLVSNNVTSMAQSGDGNIWLGTDEGLVLFNGNEFIHYGGFYLFDGVNDMITTSDKGVWYATSTYGGAVYLGSRFHHFDDLGENISNYATCVCEAGDKSVYVGSLTGMARIDVPSGYVVSKYEEEGFFFVRSLAAGEDVVAGTNVRGDIFFLKDGKEIYREEMVLTGDTNVFFVKGFFLVGCSDGRVLIYDSKRPEQGCLGEIRFSIDGLQIASGINNIFLDENRLWVLFDEHIGYAGFGEDVTKYAGKTLCINELHFDSFESGFSDMMKDYQGNYWISSSKRGVLLLTKSMFSEVLSQLELDIDNANSVTVKGDLIFVACDSGLAIIDKNTKEIINSPDKGILSGKCVKDIFFDGDVCYAAVYGEGVCRLEYADRDFYDTVLILDNRRVTGICHAGGKTYALASDGCYVIEKDGYIDSYTISDGLFNSKITAVLSGSFGRSSEEKLYLGSDGAGIYVFSDGELESIIDENDKLPSKVINDMLVYGDGFFIATDNSVAYYNGRKIVELKKLPKTLEGKICEQLFIKDEALIVVCSDSVYIINLPGLFDTDPDKDCSFDLYDENSGFYGMLSKDGKGFMTEDEIIYIPCRDKVYSFSGVKQKADVSSLKIILHNVTADLRIQNLVMTPENEYYVKLGKDTKKIDIFCSVLDFSNVDPNVRYILHGVDDKAVVVRNSELEHIIYEDIPGGKHTFWFEVLDEKNEMSHRIVLTIEKEKALFEELWVRMSGLAAGFAILMYFVLKDAKENKNSKQKEDNNL